MENTNLALSLMTNGYIILDNKLSSTDICLISEQIKQERLKSPNTSLTYNTSSWKWPEKARPAFLNNISLHLPVLERIFNGEPTYIRSWLRVVHPNEYGVKWHQDHDILIAPVPIIVGFFLDSVTADNGATMLVPYSQWLPHPSYDRMEYSRKISLVSEQGTVVLFLASVWHCSGRNMTNSSRSIFFVEFGAKNSFRVSMSPEEYQANTCHIID